jgi:hypothetical protein
MGGQPENWWAPRKPGREGRSFGSPEGSGLPLRREVDRVLGMVADDVSILEDPVARILLTNEAATASEAERRYLENHLDEVLRLVESPLSDREFRRHPLIVMLLAHGSRGWEDSLR